MFKLGSHYASFKDTPQKRKSPKCPNRDRKKRERQDIGFAAGGAEIAKKVLSGYSGAYKSHFVRVASC